MEALTVIGRWLGGAAAIALLVVGGYLVGHHVGQLDEQAAQGQRDAKAVIDAQREAREERDRGTQAARVLNARIASLEDQNRQIQERTANVPRIVASSVCQKPGAARLSRAGVLRLDTALGHPVMPTGAGGVPGAVAGADSADAGYDGLAAESVVTVDQAQSNCEANFGRCTAIRTRCLGLIDYLKTRPGQGQP